MKATAAVLSFLAILQTALLMRLEEDAAMFFEHNEIPQEPCDQTKFKAKDLDLVIYGATGFTGKLVTEYLAGGHPEKPRWAIAARNPKKLQKLLDDTNFVDGKPEVIIADLGNASALEALARRTKAVITYAGPYSERGEPMIRAALKGCAHYLDITGETGWKAAMLKKYGRAAKSRGIAFVQSVGQDSVPADLLTTLAATRMAEDKKGPPTKVQVVWTLFNGAFSGGTLASVEAEKKKFGENEDPYVLVPDAPEAARVDTTVSGIGEWGHGYDWDLGVVTAPFLMESVDVPLLRRSLLTMFPGEPVAVSEVSTVGSYAATLPFYADPQALIDPPALEPKQGEGPPAWLRKKGGLAAFCVATREKPANKVKVSLTGEGDPGYGFTSRVSAEVAIAVALSDIETVGKGYQTPALVLGPHRLASRLQRARGIRGGPLVHVTYDES